MCGPSSDHPEAAHEIERLLDEAVPHGIGNHVRNVGASTRATAAA